MEFELTAPTLPHRRYTAAMNPANNLFPVRANPGWNLQAFVSITSATERAWTAHRLLGHQSVRTMRRALQSGLYAALKITEDDLRNAHIEDCPSCKEAKITRQNGTLAVSTVQRGSPAVGAHLHVDIVFTRMGNRLHSTLVAVDETTGFTQYEHLGEWRGVERERGDWGARLTRG